MDTLYPYGYGSTLVTMRRLREIFAPRMHPEYARRLFNWIEWQDGLIGIGGGWRAGGTQPDKEGFAPEGKSFHQDQSFNDGFVGYAAVDTVARNGSRIHRAPHWSEVPIQGSQDALRWGVHANVGVPGNGESWHIQPVEVDGWQRWWDAGRPSPRADYPIPTRVTTVPQSEEADMIAHRLRVIDTRDFGSPLQGGVETFIPLPAPARDAKTVLVNVTAVSPSDRGYITVWGSGARPSIANLSFERGSGNTNAVAFTEVANGGIKVVARVHTHAVIDLQGYTPK